MTSAVAPASPYSAFYFCMLEQYNMFFVVFLFFFQLIVCCSSRSPAPMTSAADAAAAVYAAAVAAAPSAAPGQLLWRRLFPASHLLFPASLLLFPASPCCFRPAPAASAGRSWASAAAAAVMPPPPLLGRLPLLDSTFLHVFRKFSMYIYHHFSVFFEGFGWLGPPKYCFF
jgi:hypothetical protein